MLNANSVGKFNPLSPGGVFASVRANSNHTDRFFDPALNLRARAELAKVGVSLPSDENPTKADLLNMRNSLRRGADEIGARAVKLAQGDKLNEAEELAGVHETIAHMINRIERQIENIDAGGSLVNAKSASTAHGFKVLAKSDRYVDSIAHAERPNFGFGQYVKAMVMGTDRPDVRAALSEGTDSAGGYTVPTYLMGQLIDLMRAQTVVVQADALTVPLETQQTTIARLASDPQAAWRLENAAVAQGDPTFEAVTFEAHSLAVLVKVSRELLEDSVNLDAALLNAFAGAMAVKTDQAALFGTDTAPEPRGVFNTSGINEVSMGANGDQLDNWGKVLDTLLELKLDNAADPSAMVMAPRTWRTIEGFTDTTGQPLRAPVSIERIPRLSTTLVPVDQTHGMANNASPIIVGDFSQMMLGVRSGLRVEVLRERFADNLQYAFLAHLRFDVQLAQPKAFAALKGIIPA